MSDTPVITQLSSLPARRRARQGQSVVVALLVLLLLGLVGALFVTVVARNVINARHANRVVSADYYAKAGITFADAQLTYSADGADWRPPLQNTLAVPPVEARELARYSAAVAAVPLTAAAPTDPDKGYLDAGFTRYTTGAGRFLLRVTYDPVNISGEAVPPGRYLKIEAIGREGVIDPLDPTTYANNRSSDRTQAYQLAYKPIGITDYARFETNPDNRSDIANLGVVSQLYTNDADGKIATAGATDFIAPGSGNYQLYPVVTTYGAADALLKSGATILPNPYAGTGSLPLSAFTGYVPTAGGGSLHSNMGVRFFGKTIAYMYNSGADAPAYQDTFEIGGNLLLDSYNPAILLNNSTATATLGQRAALSLNPTNAALPMQTGTLISPTNAGQPGDVNPSFNTQNGLVRDGSMQNDLYGQPRDIKRLEPPLMDSQDPATSLPRYKAIAMMSAPRINPSTGVAYTGSAPGTYGYGRSIYINNPSDIQRESTAIGGGTTLTDDWLNTSRASTSGAFSGWNGALYDPVGVNITLGMQTASITNAGVAQPPFAGIRMSRSDNTAWTASTGAALSGTAPDGNSASTMYVRYADLNASNDPTSVYSSDNLNNDVVIYAEGNVRVHGIVSPNENLTGIGAAVVLPRHITIVSNGTAYIDGSILKGSPDSSITIIAHDYVCVNTTQFLAGPQTDENAALLPTGTNGYTIATMASPLTQELNFALPDPTKTLAGTYTTTTITALYVAGEPESTENALVDFNIIDATGASVIHTESFSALSHKVFDLANFGTPGSTPSGALNMKQTDLGRLEVSLNPGAEGDNTTSNFFLQRAAILPGDIRIEAILYAQTRSFFVIPGPSFNASPDDTLDAFAASATAANPGGSRPVDTDPSFPMFGQPIDMKIVIDGAVSEAQPADINAQTAWMLRWGWIPKFHGTMLGITGPPAGPPEEDAGHPNRIGLQMIYNPQAGYPYNPGDGTAATPKYYLRSDKYGRPLPFTPRLPVSTALLYAGESGEAPILQ